jgi:hypothetical protein
LNDLVINVSTTLGANVTVNDTLKLNAGTLTNNPKTVTIDSSATILVAGGSMAKAPLVTSYDLKYIANSPTGTEFVSGKVNQLTVDGVTLTLTASSSVKNILMTKSSSEIALAGYTLTATGNLDIPKGSVTGAGSLTLGGVAAQTITAPAGGLTLAANLTLNNPAGFVLSGGNLIENGTLIFIDGVLSTGDNTVLLKQTSTGPGFNHDGVVAPKVSHINGNVRHNIFAGAGTPTLTNPNGRFEFPVGTNAKYRPFDITFSSAYPNISPTNVTVKMVDSSPEGIKNLPITASSDLKIGNYPNYYWLVKTSPSSFTNTQQFDVEMHATNLGYPYDSDQNLRIIRRQDGSSESNGWAMQGTNASYGANYQVVTGTDTLAVVRTTSSIGGIVNEGTRFTIGIPTRAPSFSAPTALTDSVDEGVTTTIQVTADANDVGETITYSLVGAPAWATINATSGLLTLKPGFDVGSATAYAIVVRATDSGSAYSELTLSIIVVDANRVPSFTATGASYPAKDTVNAGNALTLTYVAIDPDGTTPTYSYKVTPAPAGTVSIAAGVLTYTPAFADAGKNFTFSVAAVDASTLGDTVATVVTVNYGITKGDLNGDGSVTSADATPILQYVVELITLTPQQLYAADVNADGSVGALDAAWILYKAINGTFPTAKMVAAQGSAEFGKYSSANNVMRVPITLQNTKGVLSLYTEVNLNNSVEFKGVKANLPEGWQIVSNLKDGTLKIAMAGLSPLTDGNAVVIEVGMKDKESVVSIQGNIKMNDAITAAMQSVTLREVPTDFSLSQNYPNPFNPTTTIKYAIPQDARVNLVIYNILGQAVKTLVNLEQQAGYYTARWDGTNDYGSHVASGIYIYRISAGSYTQTIKMNLIK